MQHHRGGAGAERKLIELGWGDIHIGVHTATMQTIAAGYAMSAARNNAFTTHPVVYDLDVSSLVPEPDTDALLWWYEYGGDIQAKEFVADPESYEVWDQEEILSVSVLHYAIEYLPRQVSWADVNPSLALTALQGRHDAIRELLIELFPQRRYLVNFDLERVVRIRSFRPWYADFVADPEDLSRYAERASDKGFDLLYSDDLVLGEDLQLEWRTLYESPHEHREIEYHGASGVELELAFPELGLTHEDIWDIKD